MKKRIKIDNALLSIVIILTGFLYQFPHLYSTSETFDNVMDFIGMILIMKGMLIRMIARGHKKYSSKKGEQLVTTGIYSVTRNPMYLGSFYMGAGFVSIVWPWWTLPVFTFIFYVRFVQAIEKEEKHLNKVFGDQYAKYCKKVSRSFPDFETLRKVKFREVFNPHEAWSTKEKQGLIWWPLLAVILETIQERVVFYATDLPRTVLIFLGAVLFFGAAAWVEYETRN